MIGVYEFTSNDNIPIALDSGNIVGSSILNFYQILNKQTFSLIDTTNVQYKNIDQLILGSKLLISLNIVGNDNIDLTFFGDMTSGKVKRELTDLFNTIIKENSLVPNTRVYKEIEIHELGNTKNIFSYVIHEGYFIGSFTPFLVEDAIRTMIESDVLSFKSAHSELFSISKLNNDQGNIYVNGDKIADLLMVLSTLKIDGGFYKSAFYDLDTNPDQVLMNGFAYLSPNQKNVLAQTRNQSPTEINVKRLIPNNTAFLYHVGINDVQKLIENSNDLNSNLSLDSIKINFDKNILKRWIGNEIALIELESNRVEKLLLIEAIDINECLNQINTIAEQAVKIEGDTLYYEVFADYTIKELKINNFPKRMLGPVYEGFDDCFYTIIDNYLAISASIDGMKMLINQIENEDTWGKSLDKNQFLQNTMTEANVSLFFDVNKVWGRMLNALNETWSTVLEQNDFEFRKFQMGAIQFSNIDNKYYSTIVLKKSMGISSIKKGGAFDVEKTTYLESRAITKPFIVRNHIDNSFEALLQDSLTKLYLISNKGEILWTDSIGENIIDDIVQIDYYKNRKLQYFFASSNHLHLIDRNGHYVEGFPFKLGFEVSHASVIDYDNSKHYRFLIANMRGDLYVFDKELNNLEGWKPRVLSGPISNKAEHIRVRGKDMIVAVEKEGVINVLNRQGNPYSGFPINLEFTIKSSVFMDIASNFSNSTLNLISTDGELISIDLNGKVIKRKQFYKPEKATQFSLAISNDNMDFIIYRYDKSRLSILDKNDNIIFEKDYLNSDITDVQYYNLGVGREVYAVTDAKQQFTYIYNHLGELINSAPIDSGFKIGLLDFTSQNKKYVYSVIDNYLTVYSY